VRPIRADYSAPRVPGITASGVKGPLSGLCRSGQFIGSSVTVITSFFFHGLQKTGDARATKRYS
jgi:hypothetical protein